MPSRYGFESDIDRRQKADQIQSYEKAKRLSHEHSRQKAQDKRLADLSVLFGQIDQDVKDILIDFTNASPSFFNDSSQPMDIMQISGSVLGRWQKFKPQDTTNYNFSQVDYGEEGEEISHSWIVADSLAIMLAWVSETNQAGLQIIDKTTNIPKSALAHLCRVLKQETDLWCEQINWLPPSAIVPSD